MPRRPRTFLEAACVHVVNRSAGRRPIFLRASDYRAFTDILTEGLTRHSVRLISYCVMPNHWHLVMGPVCSHDLSKLMHWVTVTHAVRWHHLKQNVGFGPVYQNRFWSGPLLTADHLVATCRYVERNALRARLVRRAQDWPWGSLSERLRPDRSVPVVSTAFLVSAAWLDYVNAPRDHDDDRSPVFHNLRPVPQAVENSLGDFTDLPGGFGDVVEEPQEIARVIAGADENEADTHVEGAEHLDLADFPAALEPPEHWRYRPALAIE
jgi:putative transposase